MNMYLVTVSKEIQAYRLYKRGSCIYGHDRLIAREWYKVVAINNELAISHCIFFFAWH